MSYCQNCQHGVADDARYCAQCGTLLQGTPSESRTGPRSAVSTSSSEASSGAVETARQRRRWRARDYVAILIGASIFLVPIAVSVIAANVQSSRAAAQAHAGHEERLAWQKRHPKEYEAQVAAARAARVKSQTAERARQRREEAEQREADRIANLPENKDPCDYANGRIKQGWTDFNSAAYQAAFDDAAKGLAVNDRCSDDDVHQLNEGFLLSVKGMSEHYLSSGDSRTDLHQAETVLEECQTNPHFYGTHTGASCETQQENDIQTTTNWDVYGN